MERDCRDRHDDDLSRRELLERHRDRCRWRMAAREFSEVRTVSIMLTNERSPVLLGSRHLARVLPGEQGVLSVSEQAVNMHEIVNAHSTRAR